MVSKKTPKQPETPKPASPVVQKPGSGLEKASRDVPRPDYKPPSNPPRQSGGK